MPFDILNKPTLSRIPHTTRCLLDIGCGVGWLGREIKQRINCDIVGITISKAEAAEASKYLDEVIITNLNEFDTSGLGKFDCILCCHVLEHLYWPENLLRRLHNSLTTEGLLVVALPNILFFKHRLAFLKGRFRYVDYTAIDTHHFRFYDWQSAHALLEQNGYKVIESVADGYFPQPHIRKVLPLAVSSWFDRLAVKYFPGLFGVQFIFTARINPLWAPRLYSRGT